MTGLFLWWLVVILVDGCGYALVFSFSFILAVGYGCHTVVSVACGGGGCGGDGLWFFFFFFFFSFFTVGCDYYNGDCDRWSDGGGSG